MNFLLALAGALLAFVCIVALPVLSAWADGSLPNYFERQNPIDKLEAAVTRWEKRLDALAVAPDAAKSYEWARLVNREHLAPFNVEVLTRRARLNRECDENLWLAVINQRTAEGMK